MPSPLLRAPTPDDPSSVYYPPAPTVAGSPYESTARNLFGAPSATGTGLSASQSDAYAYLQSLLASYGLSSLSSWAYDQVIAGNSPTMVVQLLQERPEFKQRFPAIEARRKAGLPPISVAQILNYEDTAIGLFRSAGIPVGFYDSPEELQSFISNDVSLSELSTRIQLASQDYFATDPDIRGELSRLYGITPGEQIAMFLDDKTALPLIERRFTSAQLSATAIQTGFGGLTQSEAEGLAGLNVSTDAAARGFQTLGMESELFAPLPGEIGSNVTRDQQLAAQFYGNTAATQKIERTRDTRLAQFRAGGDIYATQQGVVGLRTAQT
jgi:hypothetical protein